MLARKVSSIYSDIAEKYKKIKYKQNKLKLNNDFHKQLQNTWCISEICYLQTTPNVSNRYASSMWKRLLRSATNKRDKEFHHNSKELKKTEFLLFKHLFLIDFYILNRSITSHNKRALQKSLSTQQKKLSSLTRTCNLSM